MSNAKNTEKLTMDKLTENMVFLHNNGEISVLVSRGEKRKAFQFTEKVVLHKYVDDSGKEVEIFKRVLSNKYDVLACKFDDNLIHESDKGLTIVKYMKFENSIDAIRRLLEQDNIHKWYWTIHTPTLNITLEQAIRYLSKHNGVVDAPPKLSQNELNISIKKGD